MCHHKLFIEPDIKKIPEQLVIQPDEAKNMLLKYMLKQVPKYRQLQIFTTYLDKHLNYLLL